MEECTALLAVDGVEYVCHNDVPNHRTHWADVFLDELEVEFRWTSPVTLGVEPHICDTGDFTRTVCPEPCGTMHSRCCTCGELAEPCKNL